MIDKNRAEAEAIAHLCALHIADGWDTDIATALAENGYSRDDVQHMSIREVLDCYLTWEGIIGFTNPILQVIRNLAKQKPEWIEQTCPWCQKDMES